MCYGVNKVKKLTIFIFLICFHPNIALSVDLSKFKETCSELGFKKGTEKHGSCVLTLYKKAKSSQASKSNQSKFNNVKSSQEKALEEMRQQQLLELRRREVLAQERLAKEAKSRRQLDALGLATKGLNMIRPRNNSSSSSPSKTYNFGCRTYGINTLCQGN